MDGNHMPNGRDDEHNTICAFDIEGFGKKRTRPSYVALRSGMYAAVEKAFGQSGISLAACYHEGAGDSILALIPGAIGKGTFVADVPSALVTALTEHNAAHPPEEQIRLRMALHAGEITRDTHGVTGHAIIHTARLLDAKPLKEALQESTGVLAMIASAWFYDEVVCQHEAYAPQEYDRTALTVKETTTFGWIRLPDGERHRPTEIATQNTPTEVEVSSLSHIILTPSVRPASPQFAQVVEALEAIPCMQGEHTRSFVIDHLTFASAIRYFPNRRMHVTSILRSSLDFEDGLMQLLTVISEQEPSGSLPVKHLVTLLTDVPPK